MYKGIIFFSLFFIISSVNIYSQKIIDKSIIEEVNRNIQGKTLNNNEINIEPEKLARFTHSVTASTDDTNILKLDLFKSFSSSRLLFRLSAF